MWPHYGSNVQLTVVRARYPLNRGVADAATPRVLNRSIALNRHCFSFELRGPPQLRNITARGVAYAARVHMCPALGHAAGPSMLKTARCSRDHNLRLLFSLRLLLSLLSLLNNANNTAVTSKTCELIPAALRTSKDDLDLPCLLGADVRADSSSLIIDHCVALALRNSPFAP